MTQILPLWISGYDPITVCSYTIGYYGYSYTSVRYIGFDTKETQTTCANIATGPGLNIKYPPGQVAVNADVNTVMKAIALTVPDSGGVVVTYQGNKYNKDGLITTPPITTKYEFIGSGCGSGKVYVVKKNNQYFGTQIAPCPDADVNSYFGNYYPNDEVWVNGVLITPGTPGYTPGYTPPPTVSKTITPGISKGGFVAGLTLLSLATAGIILAAKRKKRK
jgi:hypothetical protein